MKKIFLSLILLLPNIMFATLEQHTIERPNQTQCHYYFDKDHLESNDFSIILVLGGSETTSATRLMSIIDEAWCKKSNSAVLAIEKSGISADSYNQKEYFKYNSLTQRADDCLMVLDHIRNSEPNWNGKLVLFGGSEGATLAAYITPLIPEVVATVIFSGGCGMSLRNEILLLIEKGASSGLLGFFEKIGKQSAVNLVLSASHLFPNSTLTGIGNTNTLKWWHLIADYNPIHTLESVSTPLYVAHGAEDRNTPIESSEKLAQHFESLGKRNLLYRRYDGLDHHFNDTNGDNHFGTVVDEALDWVANIINPAIQASQVKIIPEGR